MKPIAFLLALPVVMAVLIMLPNGARADTVIDDWNAAKVPPPPVLKSVTIDPKKTALLDMDFSRKTCTPQGRPRCAAMLPTIRGFIDKARALRALRSSTSTVPRWRATTWRSFRVAAIS